MSKPEDQALLEKTENVNKPAEENIELEIKPKDEANGKDVEGGVETERVNEKKSGFRRTFLKCPAAFASMCEQPTFGLDVSNRDPRGNLEFVQDNFVDVFAERDGVHSFEKTYTGTNALFTCTRLWIYKILSIFIGLPLSLVWAVLFTLVALINTYLFLPLFQLLRIPIVWIRVVVRTIVYCTIGVLFEAFGRGWRGEIQDMSVGEMFGNARQ